MDDSLLLGYSRDRQSITITGMINLIFVNLDLDLDFLINYAFIIIYSPFVS